VIDFDKEPDGDRPHPISRMVLLEVRDRGALLALAEALGEIAADLWIAGKLDVD